MRGRDQRVNKARWEQIGALRWEQSGVPLAKPGPGTHGRQQGAEPYLGHGSATVSALLTSGQRSAEPEHVPGPPGLTCTAAFIQFPREALAPKAQRSAGSESSGSQCGVLAPETCVKVGSPHGQDGGGRRVHRAGGQTPSSSPALSPSPQPPPSSCGLPHSTPSLCRATHFPPGDTGDRSPGLRLLHQLDVM